MPGTWKPISEYVEPDWDAAADVRPMLVWRVRKGAAFGFVRDGELFDDKWVYICDANKVTHFIEVQAPDETVVAMEPFRTSDGPRRE